jgi:lipopolysaccharide biosynthesis glycosyltransferase
MASDNKGIEMLAVTLYSIIKNNNNDIRICIIHTDISTANQKDVSKLESIRKNISVKFHKIDSSFFSDVELTNQTVSMPAYYRYFAPDILINENRALYVDFDMLCIANLSDMYNIDMQGNYLAAVEDYYVSSTGDYPGFKEGTGLKSTDVYYNSGLLLMDLNKIRSSGIMDTFWNNVKNKSKIIPKQFNIFADQTVTNITFKDKFLQLDYKYNSVVSVFKYKKISSPSIIHFSGRDKPFTCYDDYSAKYSDMYYDYYKDCMKLIGKNPDDLLKKTMHKLGSENTKVVNRLSIAEKIANDKTHHVEELINELNKANIKISDYNNILDGIYKSKSWKITKPLRYVKKIKSQKRM